MQKRRHPDRWKSYSLVELLVVLAIVSIVAVLAVLGLSSLWARNLDRATYDLAGIIEQARNEAMSRQTYVWLGVFPTQTSSGNMEVQVAMVGSKDGTGTNIAQSNLINLSKIIHISNVALTSWGGLKTATRGLFTNAVPASLATNSLGITFAVVQTQFTGTTLTFTPEGEVLLKGAPTSEDGFTDWIDLSIRQAHGTVVPAGADDASVVIEGATGAVKIVCLN